VDPQPYLGIQIVERAFRPQADDPSAGQAEDPLSGLRGPRSSATMAYNFVTRGGRARRGGRGLCDRGRSREMPPCRLRFARAPTRRKRETGRASLSSSLAGNGRLGS
jgi:hypothetical protein